ncbi:MAG: MXAN_6640 family putative metalloprotease, partial [Nocardioides sp.]
DTSPADGVPDWVDEVARVVGNVWKQEITGLSYRAPLPDRGTAPAGTANDEGPDTGLDVYLGDIGRDGYYGYAATDRTSPRTSSAYLVLDDDFKDFPGTPAELLRVTAAHEFFHIVQFAYDQYEDGWFMEATATWMEERVYDSVNDNRQFLPASAMAVPGRSLDYPLTNSTAYGNWIFFEFLSRRLGGAVVRSMWTRAASDGVYSTVAISRTLRAAGTSLRSRFAGFAAGNLTPARTYAEGKSYRRPRVAATYTLSSGTKSTGSRSLKLDHLTARSYAFTAGSSLTGSRKLRLTVNGPSGISGAVATVTRKDGTLLRRSVPLSSAGNGALTLPFSRSSVSRVTLTLSNTSVRYTCGAGSYSCDGQPRDQNRPFTWSASATR